MGSTVTSECLSEHRTAPNPLSYQLVTDSWRLVAEVLGLGQDGWRWERAMARRGWGNSSLVNFPRQATLRTSASPARPPPRCLCTHSVERRAVNILRVGGGLDVLCESYR